MKKMKNTTDCLPNVSDYQENSYKCNKCRDMMFIIQEDETAKPCECRAIRIAEDKLKASGVSEEFRKMRFENFDYSKSKETMIAYSTAKSYSNKFEELRVARKNSIMFCGQVGSGKTHLAMSIANILLDKGIGVIYMPYRSSITNLKQSILDEENYQREIIKYKNAQVLMIDDLLKGRITESDINIMYEIINYRYFKNLPIEFSTTEIVWKFESYSNKIFSSISFLSIKSTSVFFGL